ncbi:aminopeptidase N [Nocardioides luteus]|uniref:Aminopeptidase N n=1 Tax=Nocardioides luteus TaxID=1844 RepID=A0ABQ5T116_9ACTN|nr:aminopeptidase N [Nocardioides luteus]MDR7310451.1 aminopeptidase N [Nocardioides luteus]GGR52628.1 putative aminopeptidase [Nocardioides luteus]GLJ69769.1 putative aminopeptidase [Nocardioides luteus]
MSDTSPAAPASLTQEEAATRAATITVDRYDIALDMTGLLEGETLSSVSTITFSARPGSSTFVDCVADVSAATLNGAELDLATISAGRIPLTDLAETNTLVVSASQSDTASSEGVLRTVDPSDGNVYVWTSFEPDDARRLWACFDQPDLKAVHAFTVAAPEEWTVLSNSAPASVSDAEAGARTWVFEDTPPLSTYVVVVNAGPFVEVRAERGGYDLGLYARRSLESQLERDREEILDITEHGLAWYGSKFAMPFPQRRYDQIFVPDMGGAMENWGAVTHSDTFIYRTPPTQEDRTERANVILHEMAHMWFGDLVTMRWWDDLWLNEAFASWAAVWASAAVPGYEDVWASIALTEKKMAYDTDLTPATHPIRGVVPSVDVAMANFDAITYMKGQAVLQQLHAYIGEEAYLAGLQAYFAEHAYGNTVLDDLMSAFGAAAGKDLTAWTTAWLDHAGTDVISLADGKVSVSSADGTVRPHRLDIASYDAEGGLLATTPVTVEDGPVEVDLPDAAAHLLNATDVTFAATRSDEASEAWLGQNAGRLPDAVARAVAVSSAWAAMFRGEIAGPDVVSRVASVLEHERNPQVTGEFLSMAAAAAELWTPPARVAEQRTLVADAAAALATDPANRDTALRVLAAHATTPEQLALAEEGAAEDVQVAWRLLGRRAETGDYDAEAVAALEARDPDPESWVSALGVRTARPLAEAKEEAWQVTMVERRLPRTDSGYALSSAFWRPGQEDVLAPYAQRYLDAATAIRGGGLLAYGLQLRLYPVTAGEEVAAAARAACEGDALVPFVRQTIIRLADVHCRQVAARSR